MNIKHMRLVLPSRMRVHAQVDARTIAEAVAHGLQGHAGVAGPVKVQIQAQGRPAIFIARDVFKETRRQVQIQNQGG